MRQFTYQRATSAQEAVAAYAMATNARYIAGGTNLLDLMKLEIEAPGHVIDINHIGLDRITETPAGGLRVGALVRNADLATDQRIRSNYPVLARALVAAASGQLRNMATTGGNLMQRTRCPYFYDTNQSCAKRDPNTPCSAIVGFNRNHAVQGVGNCLCAFPSDMSVALRVLDAVVEVMQPGGTSRQIPIADFHLIPDTLPIREFALNPGELITGVVLPAPPGGRHYYRKVRNRASFAFALVSVAAIIQRDGSGRIALGGVATKPWRTPAGDAAIPQGAKAVTAALMRGAQPTDQNRYKIALTERTIAAVLAQAKAAVS